MSGTSCCFTLKLICFYPQCQDAGGGGGRDGADHPLHDGHGGCTGVVPTILGPTVSTRAERERGDVIRDSVNQYEYHE